MQLPNDHALEHVDAYLHDVLPAEVAKTVEQHCAACPICQVALEEARKRFEAMQILPPVEAPEELIRTTQQRIDKARRFALRPARIAWSLAGAAAVVIACFHVYYLTLTPTPYDLRVLGQSEWLSGSEASLRVMLVDHRTNAPVADVPVDIELAGTDSTIQLASFRTDRFGSGTPRFRLPEWDDGQYELRVRAATPSADAITHVLKLRRSWQLMLTTDKPLYQPGQTIHARGLGLRRPDLKPVAGQEVVFTVADPKGNLILRKRDVTSRFGIASIDCALADEILEGPYRVECRLGDTTSAVSVEIKKYVLPKFKIDVDLDRPYYQPGGKVRGTVRAAYFFGKAVEKGEVRIEVRAADTGPCKPVRELAVQTDSKGEARFEFPLPESFVGRPQESGDARVELSVTVRDAAGQEQNKSVSRVVTAQPIRIEVIPEAGTLVPGVENTIYFFTSCPDGRPVRTRIAVSGLDRELDTSELGVASFTFTPGSDKVRWTVLAADAEGRASRREVTLETGQPGNDFLVRTDRAVYDGGQNMQIVVRGGGVEPVFLDLIKDGQTMLTECIEMADGGGEHQLDLPPELFGTIELVAYRFGRDGLPVIRERTLYVRQAGALRVDAALEKNEFRPSERAKIKFKLTDEQGKPVPGALSLAAVDEAVFRVLQQRPGMEQAFFTLERELLKPVYAIYPWTPERDERLPAEERNGLEQAAFSRTVQHRAGAEATNIIPTQTNSPGDWRRRDTRDGYRSCDPAEPTSKALSVRGLRPYSLTASTQIEKAREVAHARDAALDGVGLAWGAFAATVVIGLIVLLSHKARDRGLVPACADPSVSGCASVLPILGVITVTLTIVGLLAISAAVPVRNTVRNARNWTDAQDEPTKLLDEAFDMVLRGSAPHPGSTMCSANLLEKIHGQNAPRLRQWFPETLLWRPELITDDNGQAQIDFELADSITDWRLSTSAVSAEGKLGGAQTAIRVFQPFFVDLNLPAALTRGDEVTVPAVVYNYLDRAQTVEFALADAEWFEPLDEPKEKTRKIELSPGEVRSFSYRLRAKQVGRFELRLDAHSGEGPKHVADAIQRTVEVVPDGRRVEQVFSGTLDRPAEIHCAVPAEAIEGSAKLIVKIHPSSFSQLLEGLDAIFQRPYGCFEQTSSTTYPNVLTLDYLRRTKKSVPDVEAKARQYIHLGYQRLLTFEVAGGGFDWFGHAPANRTLTAYGLMEFTDMARVHDVDPQLIERTRQWLFAQQQPDGSWEPEGHGMHDDPTGRDRNLARLGTTAYIAWAAFAGQPNSAAAKKTRDFLAAHEPVTIEDPYLLALVANALMAIDGAGSARPCLARLEAMKQSSADKKLAWWSQATGAATMFHGQGRGGSIETTATAALALIQAGGHQESVRHALAWLVTQKDAAGTWHSTQATVLALKALLAGTGKPLGGDKPRRIDIALDGQLVRQLAIPAEEADVMRQVDLSAQTASGRHKLAVTETSGTASGYQVEFRYYVPETLEKEDATDKGPLAIELSYDRTELAVHDVATAMAKLTNLMPTTAPMVILDLPIPAGFAVEAEGFEKLAAAGTIAKYQLTARSAIVYLRQIEPGRTLELRYRLRATTPVRVTVAPARAYEYYDPDKSVASAAARLTVR